MATVRVYGPPTSSHVRTARMVCAAKGVFHELVPIERSSDTHRALHPFARVPVMQHGDVWLYETQAIIRYIDAVFEGAPLVPDDAAALGAMEQWISVHNCYLYEHLYLDYALAYLRPAGEDGQPDRAVINAALPALEHDIGLLDRALAGREWVAGRFSLADLMLGPLLATVAPLPEGTRIIEHSSNVRRWLLAIERRPSGPLLIPPRCAATLGHRPRWTASSSPSHGAPRTREPTGCRVPTSMIHRS